MSPPKSTEERRAAVERAYQERVRELSAPHFANKGRESPNVLTGPPNPCQLKAFGEVARRHDVDLEVLLPALDYIRELEPECRQVLPGIYRELARAIDANEVCEAVSPHHA